MDGHRASRRWALPIEAVNTQVPVTDGSGAQPGAGRGHKVRKGPQAEKALPAEPATKRPAQGSFGAESGFRGPQVCSIIGITYRQLDYWARTDLLRPSLTDARGSGSQRQYSYTDLVQLKVIKRLIEAGVSLRATRKAVECLRTSGADLASAQLVIADNKTVLANSGEELFDLLRGGQGVLSIVLGLDRLVSEVDAAITELREGDGTGTVSGQAQQAQKVAQA